MKIIIATNTGHGYRYTFQVNPTTTVAELREQFFEETNTPANELRNTILLIFNGDSLTNPTRTLATYGIYDGCHLESHMLGIQARGNKGVRFVDTDNDKALKRFEWSHEAPLWRIAGKGLCLEGRCMNESCKAYNNMVVMSMGYIEFDIVREPNQETTVCPVPSCGQFVEPITCAFNNCWWKFNGSKVNEMAKSKAPVKCSSDWKHADDAYHRFDEVEDEMVTWRILTLCAIDKKPN